MVEIREETENSTNNNSNQNEKTSTSQTYTTPNFSFVNYIKANINDTACFFLRLVTIYFAFAYIFSVSNPKNQRTAYLKAFISAAATNTFRLHHRLKNNSTPVLSRLFLNNILFEDSAHYLFYCLIFAMSTPVTMALVPITLYAFLHGVNYFVKLGNATGNNQNLFVIKATQILSNDNRSNILSMIACAEIAVIPIFIAMIFVGKSSILFPFIYYRFISMRYLSRRNPYVRDTFATLKFSLFRLIGHQLCPVFVRNIVYKIISIIELICPRVN